MNTKVNVGIIKSNVEEGNICAFGFNGLQNHINTAKSFEGPERSL